MHEETKGEDGDHDGDDRSGHEVAAQLEESVTFREKARIGSDLAEYSPEGIDYRKEIDGSVKEEENHQESAADALYEFLPD